MSLGRQAAPLVLASDESAVHFRPETLFLARSEK